jgi:hypothetical protein
MCCVFDDGQSNALSVVSAAHAIVNSRRLAQGVVMWEYLARVVSFLSVLVFVAVAACVAPEESVEETATAASALDLTTTFYDGIGSPTQCSGFGVIMHCCPSGFVMIGAQVDRNVFKCAMLNTGAGGARFADHATQRNGMHACPFGSVMVGLHSDQNVLTCQWLQEPFSPVPSSRVLSEYVDGPAPNLTFDRFPMHVCQPGYAMAGIHVSKNLFTCDS